MRMINIKDRKGVALLVVYIVIVILLILGVAFTARSIAESRIAERQKKATQAFWLAEAGLERTLYELKQDFENALVNPSWADNDINGLPCGKDTVNFYPLPYASTSLGSGFYRVELKNVAGKVDEVWVRSTGTVGEIDKLIEAYVKIEDIFPWNNVIFAGTGSAGTLINGNVDVRGSVILLGSELKPTDFAVDMSGDGHVGNNYDEISQALEDRIPPCPTTTFGGEVVESLEAKLRVKTGLVKLDGSATVGEGDLPDNPYKETVDAVFVTDGFTGNQGAANVSSDNGTEHAYDIGDGVLFPSLGDPYDIDPAYTYQDYLKDNAFVVSDPVMLNQLANITPNSNFSYGDATGSISMDGSGNMTINGIVYIDGGNNLNMNMRGNEKTITYSGSGSILVTGDVGINVNLLAPMPVPPNTSTFPTNILGIMTPNRIDFNAAQIDVMGIFYAEDTITSQKQTRIAGTFASNYFDMGQQVPKIFQVPEVADNLPPGMIANKPVWSIKTVLWQKQP